MKNTKKVAILTLVDYKNYGNRLQNLALQLTLEKLGHVVETLIIDDSQPLDKYRRKVFKALPLLLKARAMKSIVRSKIIQLVTKKLDSSKSAKFLEFSKERIKSKNINLSNYGINDEINANYDYVVVGSDQVWNPGTKGGHPLYFLPFVEPAKRIAYAPSFGISKMPKEFKTIHQERLLQFKDLSVREDAGAHIIQSLINKEVPVVLDPTLLLTKKEWLDLKPLSTIDRPQKYILTYVLGSFSQLQKEEIYKHANKHSYSIIDLADPQAVINYAPDPLEFIHCINNAELFCTDSFHGTIFAILMNTPFVVYERLSKNKEVSMNSRLETLLMKFKFENRWYTTTGINDRTFDTTFKHVNSILEIEKEGSIDFLKSSLR